MIHRDEIELIKQFYKGFYIQDPVGNNAFSFEKRRNKKIYIPPFKYGNLDELAVSLESAFSEFENGKEFNPCGLTSFFYLFKNNKHIFIFDNHNHAFFFWSYGILKGHIKKQSTLVHVDQHTDMREPVYYLSLKETDPQSMAKVFDYTNHVLNVGNFIKPAVALGFFNEVIQISSEKSFSQDMPEGFVLDIDMDVFADDMKYIPDAVKMDKVRTWLERASWVTIATSPYFMDQSKAISLIKEMLS